MSSLILEKKYETLGWTEEQVTGVLDEVLQRLVALRPDRIVLFGSWAWGEPKAESDIDLYIVTGEEEMPESWAEKSRIYQRYARVIHDLQGKMPIDLLVHTRAMHRKFMERGGSFAQEIQQKGQVLYDGSQCEPQVIGHWSLGGGYAAGGEKA